MGSSFMFWYKKWTQHFLEEIPDLVASQWIQCNQCRKDRTLRGPKSLYPPHLSRGSVTGRWKTYRLSELCKQLPSASHSHPAQTSPWEPKLQPVGMAEPMAPKLLSIWLKPESGQGIRLISAAEAGYVRATGNHSINRPLFQSVSFT